MGIRPDAKDGAMRPARAGAMEEPPANQLPKPLDVVNTRAPGRVPRISRRTLAKAALMSDCAR